MSIPFYLSIYNLTFINSFFEAVSGFTSTGFTIFENIKNIDQSLILWRSTTQWIGGLYFLFSIIYLIDIYNDLGLNYEIDDKKIKNLYDIYIRIYYSHISSENFKQILNYLNLNNDNLRKDEIMNMSNVFTTLNNDLILENEIIKTLDLDLSESDFEKVFSESKFWSDKNEKIEVHKEEPVFDGQYSNECYIDRMEEAFEHFNSFKKIDFLNKWNHLIFHLPYAFHGRRMIFNNWLSWVKKDEKLKDLVQEIGEENSEDWLKKAYKSNLYKNFIKEKING